MNYNGYTVTIKYTQLETLVGYMIAYDKKATIAIHNGLNKFDKARVQTHFLDMLDGGEDVRVDLATMDDIS
jgi:hypothetical protein